MKNKSLMVLALAVGAALHGPAYAQAADIFDQSSYRQPGGAMYFFEHGMPDTITASSESEITIESRFSKDGKQSLAWAFQPESTLTFTQDIGYKTFVANNVDQSQSTFSTWIYNQHAQAGTMHFAFLVKGQEKVWFDINMDFSGWRQLLIPFSDMEGQADEQMDQLVIRPGEGLDSGAIYLDQLMTSIPVDPRWPTRDAVVPYINLAADVAPNRHWLALYRYHQFLQPQMGVTADQALPSSQDITNIGKKLDSFILDGVSKKRVTADKLQAFNAQYDSYQLSQQDGVVTGLPLDNGNRLKTFLDKGVNKGLLNDEGFNTVFDVKMLRNYGDFMLELAVAMRANLTSQQQRDLETMYLNLTRYALAQGYTAGSGLGTAHHMGYTLRALFQAHYLSRDLLNANDLADDVSNMMAWFSGTGRMYRPVEEMTNFNVDIMNTQLRGMLYSVLMQPEAQRQQAWLAQFSFWLSQSITHSDGLGGGFKADGSVFHHAQHYPAYAKGALKGLTPVIEALSRTPFAVTPQAHQTVKHATAMTEVYSNDQLTLMSVTGRHPDGVQSIELTPFQHMAMAGSPDGSEAIDRDMASAYLRMVDKNDAFSRQLKQAGIEAGVAPQGNWVMNLASMNIQRRDNWVAAVRGFSRYLVSHESYANANRYGRYINYGQLEVMGADGESRAFSHDGWNWNRWPGTTAVQVPYAALNAQLRNVDTFSGLEEMLMSEQTYAGGVGNGDNGMYAMILQGHPKYDASFKANKSVFFFDNRIVALGSGIQTEVSDYPTQTTLFQHAIRTDSDTMTVNGQPFSGSAVTVKAGAGGYVQLADPDGNTYFVPASNHVKTSQQEQQSVHQKNSSATSGAFATAVIDHGQGPKNGHYEYAVLVAPNADQVTAFTRQLAEQTAAPYTVVQQDNTAHVVQDRQSATTSYAVFAPKATFDEGVIADVAEPAMIMAAEQPEGLLLSLVNPDLNLYQGRDASQYDSNGVQKEVSIYSRKWKDNLSQPVANQLTLRGEWQAHSALPKGVKLSSTKNGMTVVSFSTVNADTLQVLLTHK
ncbi:chondroitinase family polysaccharide lyase [Photobacterium nomapromontoriensis]|uniref:chondroitinase family polysaccharide lyase n=1 Tax=Photobacterium nomapromontoriensis TaxID=2910237 RepID=UPI003D120985